MKKLICVACFSLGLLSLTAQDATYDYYETSESRWLNPNCDSTENHIMFNGEDPLGAQVLVVYNKEFDKVYQERSVAGITTYARYTNRELVNYGTISNPGARIDFAQ